MKERAQLEAAELDKFNLGMFLKLIEVAESWESVMGEVLCMLALVLLLLHSETVAMEHRNRNTLALTHCGQPRGKGNSECS